MGKGAGKGGAQLGKTIKGRSKDKKRDKKDKVKDAAGSDQMGEDIRMLEEYEKLNKLSEAQRIRLKVGSRVVSFHPKLVLDEEMPDFFQQKYQQQETYNTKINKKLLMNLHRKFMRQGQWL